MPRSATLPLEGRFALVTGASKRIGAVIAGRLHAAGARTGIHYRNSAAEAESLSASLNHERADSAAVFQADLTDVSQTEVLLDAFVRWAGGIDCLVNNASDFFPTPVGQITERDWDMLLGSNLKGPLFLSQAAFPHLRQRQGMIVNIVDIHARRPLSRYSVYGASKAGLAMLTRALARDMAPEVRVNGIAPGAILWPEDGLDSATRRAILEQIPLARPGDPADIAECILYLAGARYVTGEIIAVDGGRSIGW